MSSLFDDRNTLFPEASSLGTAHNTPEERFISAVAENALSNSWITRSVKLYEKAKSYGVQADTTQIKELYEVGIMRALKSRLTADVHENYQTAQKIYENQVAINQRTSNSIMLQQYSTPLPLAYLAGAYVAHEQKQNVQYFEPSAGNGLLTVALPSKNTWVNEIDRNRRNNLETYGNFAIVYSRDTSKSNQFASRMFAGIITNPPFGSWDTETVSGYKITKLEHIMSIRALDTMQDTGRAAIIIGGHTEWDTYNKVKGRQDISFFCYLHKHYNVEDTINIDGKLYGKQGTTFPIRLILINGRKTTPQGTAPLKTESDKTVKSFSELWERMAYYFDNTPDRERRLRLAKAKAKALILLLNS